MNSGRLEAAGALALALFLAGGASAALPPEVYLEARRQAGLHVQVQVRKIRLRPAEAACRIEGRVLRVFRGPARPGQRMILDAPCRFPGDVPMPGPVLWFQPGDLKTGQTLEGFFDGHPGHPSIARSQLFVVSGEGPDPRCSIEDYGCR